MRIPCRSWCSTSHSCLSHPFPSDARSRQWPCMACPSCRLSQYVHVLSCRLFHSNWRCAPARYSWNWRFVHPATGDTGAVERRIVFSWRFYVLVIMQIYEKVRAEANENEVFRLTLPNRLLYSPNIAKGECRRNKLAWFFMPSCILYSPNIRKGECRGKRKTQFSDLILANSVSGIVGLHPVLHRRIVRWLISDNLGFIKIVLLRFIHIMYWHDSVLFLLMLPLVFIICSVYPLLFVFSCSEK